MTDAAWTLRRQPELLKLATGQGVSAFGSQITLLALPLTVVVMLGASPVETGVLGAALVGRITGRLGVGSAVALGLGYAAISLASELPSAAVPLLLLAAVLTGFGGTVYNVSLLSLRQSTAPDHLLGRVNGTMQFLVWGYSTRMRKTRCSATRSPRTRSIMWWLTRTKRSSGMTGGLSTRECWTMDAGSW